MPAFTVLTVNTHKGFTLFNRRFILHELREAVRAVSADLVFLQEVQGIHEEHARRHAHRGPVDAQDVLDGFHEQPLGVTVELGDDHHRGLRPCDCRRAVGANGGAER